VDALGLQRRAVWHPLQRSQHADQLVTPCLRHHDRDALADHLVFGPPEQLLAPGVPHHDLAVPVHCHDRVAGTGDDRGGKQLVIRRLTL
jgi:hypothetical protein